MDHICFSKMCHEGSNRRAKIFTIDLCIILYFFRQNGIMLYSNHLRFTDYFDVSGLSTAEIFQSICRIRAC